jgi:Uracil DNA glycosylase superfamily
MSTFANKATRYFLFLKTSENLSLNIQILNPYKKKEVKRIVSVFFKKYFDDSKNRTFVFGINPGRFGGGLTGISFTDPVALRQQCNIENNLGVRKELSSKFIYNMIDKYGGVNKFYSEYFISAIYPLTIIKNGKNYNYYDEKSLYRSLKSYLISAIEKQTKFGANKKFAVCLGKKNAFYLNEINNEYNFFDEIRVLDHPRYIMQYKLGQLDKYLYEYLSVLKSK